jgi:N-acylneuraminate cytidylyltransferase
MKKDLLNYELGLKHVPSQELPPLYRVTDGILIAPRVDMIKWKYFHGIHPYKFIMDKSSSVDIDDIYDMACAKAWLGLKQNSHCT